jgi:tetratricopeptide (TPR) repeat protein
MRPVDEITIPTTVQAVLAARIDRLPPDQKELLQTLAVLGKEFEIGLVRAVLFPPFEKGGPGGISGSRQIPLNPLLRQGSGQALLKGEADLSAALEALQLAEFIYEQPATGEVEYTFKHALTQEVAYHSVLSERRQLVHERAAQAIEALGPGRVEDRLMEVAHHYSRSANVGKAVEYLGRAGQRAARQGAHGEAAGYLTRALELLPRLPESAARDRQELELRQSLVEMLWVTKGYWAPETIAASEHVAALAEQSGTLTQLFDSVNSKWLIAVTSGDLRAAGVVARQALDLALREASPARLGMAYDLQLETRYFSGDLAGAEEHFATGLAFFDDPGFRQWPGYPVTTFGLGSLIAWSLGRADVARDRMAQMIAAANPNNPFDLGWSECYAAAVRVLLGEYEHAEAVAAQALARAEEHQFPDMVQLSRVFLGQARAQLGRAAEGVALIRQGIAGFLESGQRFLITYFMGALAEAQAGAGGVGDALQTVEQALQANPDELVWRPENLRRRGELRLAQGQTELAEADFREAIMLAQQMGAKALELRATMSLARLLDQQGHRDAARTMLAEIYGWFTEGFDTRDLQDAKSLLAELSR